MVDSKIVKYIKDTISSGYKETDIRKALVSQGWTPQEVEEGFSIARAEAASQGTGRAPASPAQQKPAEKPQAKPQPQKTPQGGRAGAAAHQVGQQAATQKARSAPSGGQGPGILSGSFLMMAAGGVLIIANSVLTLSGVGDMLALFISNAEFSLIGMFDVSLSAFDSFLVNIIIGAFVLASSVIILKMPDRARITAAFVMVLSIISVLVGNGFMVGGVVSLIGGLFTMIGK